MSTPLLEFVGFRASFTDDRGRTSVGLRGVDLAVGRGQTVGVVGESGAGKSLLLRAAFGLMPPGVRLTTEGSVLFDGSPITPARLRKSDLLGGKVGFVFQDSALALHPLRSVGFQVGEQLRLHTDLSRLRRRVRVFDLLASVGIEDPERVAKSRPHQLSGGMRQRVMIAIAIAADPVLIVADEPTTALDNVVQRQVLLELAATQERTGAALVLVSHDLGVVAQVTERTAVMRDGTIVESGPTATLLARPQHPYTAALLAARPSLRGPRQGSVAVQRPLASDQVEL
jgi:ABC-type dipeptide/oligopeptide/nickel transport system ATPase component